jgi:hypothetical protein
MKHVNRYRDGVDFGRCGAGEQGISPDRLAAPDVTSAMRRTSASPPATGAKGKTIETVNTGA